METLRAYILSVIASSVICGCIQVLIGTKGTSSTLIKMLCGMYMAFVLIAPIQRIDFSVYGDYFSGFMDAAKQTAADGENMAKHKQEEIIKQQIESYILEKAVSLGAEITVEVTLSNDTLPVPCAISIKGAVSPYVKRVLTNYIKDQVGIPEEAQTWKQNAA